MSTPKSPGGLSIVSDMRSVAATTSVSDLECWRVRTRRGKGTQGDGGKGKTTGGAVRVRVQKKVGKTKKERRRGASGTGFGTKKGPTREGALVFLGGGKKPSVKVEGWAKDNRGRSGYSDGGAGGAPTQHSYSTRKPSSQNQNHLNTRAVLYIQLQTRNEIKRLSPPDETRRRHCTVRNNKTVDNNPGPSTPLPGNKH